MIVVRSRKKQEYIDALHQTDVFVGSEPSAGANASISQIKYFLKYFKKLVSEELKYNIDFVKEQSPNVWWYDGKRLAFRSPSTAKMLEAMQMHPDITIERLAEKGGYCHGCCKEADSAND